MKALGKEGDMIRAWTWRWIWKQMDEEVTGSEASWSCALAP